jgi:hypothetical protein
MISVTSPNHYKIAPTNAHIPLTIPMHTSLIRTNTQEWGNIYIYSYIKNGNIFASHKSSHKHKIHHRGNKNMAIVMIDSSCDSNLWSTRESLIQVTFTIPMSKGWTTPSSSCCWRRWCWRSRRGKWERLWQRLPSYPRSLQISFVYYVFLHRPIVKSLEGVYIVSFRSRWIHGVQDSIKTTLEEKVGPDGV